MKKRITPLLFFFIWFINVHAYQESTNIDLETPIDTIVYQKNTEINTERSFAIDIKEKYSGKDFQYKENKAKQIKTSNNNNAFLGFLVYFMSSIFPFLLGGFVIFVIIKIALGADIKFWKTNTKLKNTTQSLIYEDDDIHEMNLEQLLQQAITNKDFRLAIRYYYLSTLKALSKKQVINYHKDKTNSDYFIEIENTTMRTQFSYLSYVYSYVWYGEFPVDETNFKLAENKYQSFLKSLV